MDDPQQHPPMNGDDELAKALGGGLQFEETPVPGGPAAPAAVTDANQDAALAALGAPAAPVVPAEPAPSMGTMPDPLTTPATEPDLPGVHHSADTPAPAPTVTKPHESKAKAKETDDTPAADPAPKPTAKPGTGNGELDKLKASALDELRPLVGKLDLPAEEKFDTLLLIIRSTDDQSLLDEAHETAKQIQDDARRAQALLDVIKEIDYFSSQK